MSWAAVAAAGASVIGGMMAKKANSGSVSGTQSSQVSPAPRTSEGQEIWDTFMNELLGTPVQTQVTKTPGTGLDPNTITGYKTETNWDGVPTQVPVYGFANAGPQTETVTTRKSNGLKSVLQGQESWMNKPISEYQGILSDLINNRGVGAGLLNPLQFSIGGGSPVSVIPRSNLAAIGTLANLAGQNFNVSAQYPKDWSTLKFIDYLKPLALDTEKNRYGIPSTTESGKLNLPTASPLAQAAGYTDIFSSLADILSKAGGTGGGNSFDWGNTIAGSASGANSMGWL